MAYLGVVTGYSGRAHQFLPVMRRATGYNLRAAEDSREQMAWLEMIGIQIFGPLSKKDALLFDKIVTVNDALPAADDALLNYLQDNNVMVRRPPSTKWCSLSNEPD